MAQLDPHDGAAPRPWDRRRRDRLAQVVRAANQLDPLLAEMDPLGTGTGLATQRRAGKLRLC